MACNNNLKNRNYKSVVTIIIQHKRMLQRVLNLIFSDRPHLMQDVRSMQLTVDLIYFIVVHIVSVMM